MVDSRWAMTSVVRPRISGVRADCSRRSLAVSSADVASSRMRMRGWCSKVRAMDSRCRSPMDNPNPRSPTTVAYPWGSSMMRSWIYAALAASTISSCVASGLA